MKLTADVGTVAEGGVITYTATVSAPVTGVPVFITLANGQIIVIPVNGSPAAPRRSKSSNDALVGHADVTNSIKAVIGGNYEDLEARHLDRDHQSHRRQNRYPPDLVGEPIGLRRRQDRLHRERG